MKKKIKDLTLWEFQKICDKYDECADCPLCVGTNEDNMGICARFAGEREVEVDGNN